MFFDSWESLGRTLVVGVLAYSALLLFLRVSGNRTLSKLNAFDFVVTVALGSTLATILLNEDVSLAEGVLALGLLVGLQYVLTFVAVRAPAVDHLMKSEPTLLVHRGRLLPRAMRKARVVEGEVHSALRAHGVATIDQAYAVVLESDGSLSVLAGEQNVAHVLSNVKSPRDSRA